MPALGIEENPDEEINGVLADTEVTQGEEVNIPAAEGVRRSTREKRKPTAYEPSHNNKAYTYQGVININVLEGPNMQKITEIDQAYHVIGVALVEAHSLRKGLKLFGQDGGNAVQKEMQQHHDMETYSPVDPSTLSYNDKKEAVGAMVNLVKKRTGQIKARQCGREDMQKNSPNYKKRGCMFTHSA